MNRTRTAFVFDVTNSRAQKPLIEAMEKANRRISRDPVVIELERKMMLARRIAERKSGVAG
ncbi:hypothetical protein V6768_07350 [Tistrella mobilis]